MFWKCWRVLVLFVVGCRGAAPHARRASEVCTWSPRDSIRLERQYAYVELPLNVSVGSDLVMIGWQSVQRTLSGQVLPRPSGGYLLAGVRVRDSARATAIELPPGVRGLKTPRIAALTDTVVAVWRGGLTLDDTSVIRIWTASLDRGIWSAPRIIGDWKTHDLGNTYASDLVARAGDLALAAPGDEETILYLRSKGNWKRQSLTGMRALYTALFPTNEGFLLAIVDGDGLRAARLRPDGSAGPLVPVALAAGTGFHHPKLLATGASSVAATWVEGAASERSSIRAATSNDGGLTWESAPPLSVDGGLQSFDATNRGGVLFVTGRQSLDGSPWPFAAMLIDGMWITLPIPRVRNEIGIVAPRFSRQDGWIDIYWHTDQKSRMGREPPVLVRVRLGSDCWQ